MRFEHKLGRRPPERQPRATLTKTSPTFDHTRGRLKSRKLAGGRLIGNVLLANQLGKFLRGEAAEGGFGVGHAGEEVFLFFLHAQDPFLDGVAGD